MTKQVAIIGNTPLNLGTGVGADLALASHDVRFCGWPENADILVEIEKRGGLEVLGGVNELISKLNGLATFKVATMDIAQAVKGADLIIMDAPWLEIEERFSRVLPHLENGQVVHINTHGYWGAFRVAAQLRAAGKEGVTITEGPDPTMSAGYAAGVVTPHRLKRKLPVSAFPASRNAEVLPLLQSIIPTLVAAESVLQTNFESTNMMGHPAVTLFNIASFDHATAAGKGILFYKDGNSHHAGVLTDVLDQERRKVCEAYGLRFQPVAEQFSDFYDSTGSTFEEAIATTKWLQDLPLLPSEVWKRWMSADAPLLHAPFVMLARNAGVDTPLFRSFVDIFGAILGKDFWASALTLEKLGLAGKTPAEIRQYAIDGKA